jgi:hypothetical protein
LLRLVRLSAIVLISWLMPMLAIGIAIAAPGATSMSVAIGIHVENRVSGSKADLTTLIGSEARLSEEGVRENPVIEYDFASDFPVAARGGVRALTASDFGAKATIKALDGTLKVEGGVATVTVRNIEGNLGHYMDALNALKDTARGAGATSLRLEGTVANPTLMRALERVLGPAGRGVPGGPQDIWVVPLGP